MQLKVSGATWLPVLWVELDLIQGLTNLVGLDTSLREGESGHGPSYQLIQRPPRTFYQTIPTVINVPSVHSDKSHYCPRNVLHSGQSLSGVDHL